MIALDLTADEARAALDGTLTEIRRPAKVTDPRDAFVRNGGFYAGADDPKWWTFRPHDHDAPEKLQGNGDPLPCYAIRCPLGVPGALLFGREAWRSWQSEWDEDAGDTEDPGGVLTYVAYEATPRRGYRPVPDRAAITYLLDSTPLRMNRELHGPWQPAATMPLWASRFTFRNGGVRVELVSGVWTWVVTVGRVNRMNGAPVPPAELEGQ